MTPNHSVCTVPLIKQGHVKAGGVAAQTRCPPLVMAYNLVVLWILTLTTH
jgi:hypothetical protein